MLKHQRQLGCIIYLAAIAAILTKSSPKVAIFFVVVAVAAAAIWAALFLFIRPQSRIIEWLATGVVAGVQAAIIRAVWPAFSSDEKGEAICIVVSLAATLLASGFGWFTARRMNEQRQGPRFLILSAGWLAAAGVSQLGFSFALAAVAVKGEYRPSPLLPMAAAVVLILPALRVQRSAFEYEKSHPPPAPPPAPENAEPSKPLLIGDVPLQPPSYLLIPLLPLVMPITFSSLRKQRFKQTVNWKVVLPEEVPEAMFGHLEAYDARLASGGFQPMGFCTNSQAPGHATYVRIWRHPELGILIMNCRIQPGQIQLSNHFYLESYYENGTMIFTYTNPAYEPAIRRKRIPQLIILDHETSPARVIEVHAARIKAFESSSKTNRREIESIEAAATAFNSFHEAVVREEIEEGWTHICPNGEVRMSFRAACRLCCVGMPPVVQIRTWLRRRRVRRELEALR